MDLRIGTAGYSYSDWVGPFYPPKTRGHDQLAFYARQFGAVEINSSFYRPPTVEQVERMAGRTPPEFGFTLKVPRTASHERSPDDLPAFRLAADRLHDLGKLLGLLVQVPEAFHNTAPNRNWLRYIAATLHPYPVAAELRHRSWDTPALDGWATAAGVDVVSVGVPAIPSLFPPGVRVTNRRVYARLHSQNAVNWYKGGRDRYDFSYPEPVLRKWAGALKAVADAGQADSGVFFFSNCVGTQAIDNAKTLAAILKEMASAVNVIEPQGEGSRQPSLFGDTDS